MLKAVFYEFYDAQFFHIFIVSLKLGCILKSEVLDLMK